MIMGWNEGLYQISKREKSGLSKSVGGEKYSGKIDQKAGVDNKIDFSFRGKTPTTQEDVKNILFGDEVTKMVLSGSLEEPMALLFKWGYYLTMEGCSLDWASTATEKYIHERGYKIILGEECDGDQKMTQHGWKRYGKKNATNSFQTILRKKQKLIWNCVFESSSNLETEMDAVGRGDIEVVDIKDFLPQCIINDMTRKDGTRFKVRFCHPEEIDINTRLKQKVDELLRWACGQRIDNALVLETVTSGLKKGIVLTNKNGEEGNADDTCAEEDVGNGTLESPAVAVCVVEGENDMAIDVLAVNIGQMETIEQMPMQTKEKR